MDASVITGVALLLVVVLLFQWPLKGKTGPDEDDPFAKARLASGKPDMAFSAGRDAAQQNSRAQDVHIPMAPEEEPSLRSFYLDLLGLTEMRTPDTATGLDGFWAVLGTRRVYFGMSPNFPTDANQAPTFAVRDVNAMAEILVQAGCRIDWDTRYSYAQRLLTIDPAGNVIVIVRG